MNINLSDEEKIKVLNGNDLYGIMQRILLREEKIDQDREHFWVVGLANNNRILFIELISLGSVNQTLAEPMDVFSFALQKRAVRIVLVHNHPSGEIQPSEADKDLTDNLIQVGKIVKTEVFDHLIITDNTFYSFKASGLLDVLSQSLKYAPPAEIEKRLKERAAELTERATVIAKSDMILKGIEKGLSIELLAELTGLPIDEIERLKRGE